MSNTLKKSAKKQVTVNKQKSIITRRKKSLSKRQLGIIGVALLLLLSAGGYFALQYYNNTKADAASCVSRTFKRGSTGTCVKYIQTILNSLIATKAGNPPSSSFYQAMSGLTKLSVDGSFGTRTETAVKAYQRNVKVAKSASSTPVSLSADGIVGSLTWQGLCIASKDRFAGGAAQNAGQLAGCSSLGSGIVIYK